MGLLIQLFSFTFHQIVCTFVIATVIWYYVRTFKSRRLLAAIPGPPGLPLVGNVGLFMTSRPGEGTAAMGYRVFGDLCRQFDAQGMFKLKLGPKTIVILCSPETIEPFLRSQVNITKGAAFDLTLSFIGRGLITSTGEKWRTDRNLLNPAFHSQVLENYFPIFNKHSKVLVKKVGQTLIIEDLFETCSRLALDLSLETSMGVDADNSAGKEAFIRNSALWNRLMALRALNPVMHVDLIYNLTRNGRLLKQYVHDLLEYVEKVIKVCRE